MSRVAIYWLAYIIVLTSRNSFKSIWTYHSNTVTSYFYTIWAWAYPSVELVQNRGSPQRSPIPLHSWHKYPHSPFNSHSLIQVQNSFQIQQIQFQCPKVRFHCTWEHRWLSQTVSYICQLLEFLQQTAVVSFGMLHHCPLVVMCLLYNVIASAIT